MTDAIDKACLLSIPFFLYFAATRKAQLFAPQHRMVQQKDAAELASAVSHMASQSRQPADLGRSCPVTNKAVNRSTRSGVLF
jgi:hypothetical protein